MQQQPVRRPDRAAYQLAAAIRAAAAQRPLGAVAAEGAFIGADADVERVGGEVAIAAFAVGPEFEHVTPFG